MLNQFFQRGTFAPFNEDLAINATEPAPSPIIQEDDTSALGSGSSGSFVFRYSAGGAANRTGGRAAAGVGELISSSGNGQQGGGVPGEGPVQRWEGPTNAPAAASMPMQSGDYGSGKQYATDDSAVPAAADDLPQVYRTP